MAKVWVVKRNSGVRASSPIVNSNRSACAAQNAKRIFIIGSIGKRNVGDDAICHSLVNVLKKELRSADSLYIYTKEDYFARNFEKGQSLEFHFVSSFAEAFRGFVKSETLVLGGGDYIGDYGHFSQRIKTFLTFFSLGLFAKILSKRVLMINSSFSVVTGNGLALLKLILNLTCCVSVRDSRSFALVAKYAGKKPIKGFDTAILMDDVQRTKTNPSSATIRNVGFSITSNFTSPFLRPNEVEQLAKAIAGDINTVLGIFEDINLHFLAFNTGSEDGDASFVRMTMKLIDRRLLRRIKLITYTDTIADFLSRFCELDAVICCKYHSAVFSYFFEKPMIVIGYQPKNIALVEDIGLSKRALLSFQEILEGKIRTTLIELLRNPEQFIARLPVYKAKRRSLNGVFSCLECNNLM